MISKNELQRKLEQELGCTIQYGGYPCNSCFHSVGDEWNLKEDIHKYWEAVLDFRGDYDDFDWDIDIDTSQFYELIEELYNKLSE